MSDNYAAFTAEKDRLIDRLSGEKAFYMSKAKILSKTDVIPDSLYIEKDVKRGLRNANGTGVIVGLTKVGEVIGYEFDEQGNKITIDGKLYYRGYDVEDIFNNCVFNQ